MDYCWWSGGLRLVLLLLLLFVLLQVIVFFHKFLVHQLHLFSLLVQSHCLLSLQLPFRKLFLHILLLSLQVVDLRNSFGSWFSCYRLREAQYSSWTSLWVLWQLTIDGLFPWWTPSAGRCPPFAFCFPLECTCGRFLWSWTWALYSPI